MALSEVISHYRGVALPGDFPVKATGSQGGCGNPGVSRTNVRPCVDGKSSMDPGGREWQTRD